MTANDEGGGGGGGDSEPYGAVVKLLCSGKILLMTQVLSQVARPKVHSVFHPSEYGKLSTQPGAGGGVKPAYLNCKLSKEYFKCYRAVKKHDTLLCFYFKILRYNPNWMGCRLAQRPSVAIPGVK